MVDGSRRYGHWREAWRTTQSFLRATVADVDPGRVGFDGHASQRGNAVGDDQGSDGSRWTGDRKWGLKGAGGGFSVDEGNDLRAFAVEKFRGLGFGERFTPGL